MSELGQMHFGIGILVRYAAVERARPIDNSKYPAILIYLGAELILISAIRLKRRKKNGCREIN